MKGFQVVYFFFRWFPKEKNHMNIQKGHFDSQPKKIQRKGGVFSNGLDCNRRMSSPSSSSWHLSLVQVAWGYNHLTGGLRRWVKRCHLFGEGFGHSQCVFCAFDFFFASQWMFLPSNLFFIKDSACFEWIFSALLDIGHHLSLLILIDCLTNPPWHTFLTEIAYHRKTFLGTPVTFTTFFRRIFIVVFAGHLQGSLWNLWN